MYNIDTSLIKMITDHYWIKRDSIVEKRTLINLRRLMSLLQVTLSIDI
jgi:hypothetical protein